MLLYRALSQKDIDNLNNGKDIYSTLYDNYINHVSKSGEEITSEFQSCFSKDSSVDNSLNKIVEHISGTTLKNNTSPWISTSTNFNTVACTYSVPKAGICNSIDKRKPIACIKEDNIYSLAEEIEKLKNEKNISDFGIDLRKEQLEKLYTDEVIKYLEEKRLYNSFLNKPKSLAKIYDEMERINKVSKQASTTNEILIHKLIHREKILSILSPILIDIIYGSHINPSYMYLDIFKSPEIIREISYAIYEDYFLYKVYNNIDGGVNLTDILYEEYNYLEGSSIEEKYEILKNDKLTSLNLLNNKIKHLTNNQDINRLLDDQVLAMNIDNLIKLIRRTNVARIKKVLKNLILIEDDNCLFKYNPVTKSYEFEDKSYDALDILRLSKKFR